MMLPDRIADKIEVGDCWEWTGYTDADGYGRPKEAGKNVYAHRLVWEILVGPIPEGMQIDHLCRNPPCCNPGHLEPVTQAENIRRGHGGKGNQRYVDQTPVCMVGHVDNFYDKPNGTKRCRACNTERQRESRRRRAAS